MWDDLAARAIQQPKQQGHAIDEAELVERVSEELGAMEQQWALERAALVAQIEDLQRLEPSPPRPTGTAFEWAERLKAQGMPDRDLVVAWRSGALRRLAAIGITTSDVTIVRLADALLGLQK